MTDIMQELRFSSKPENIALVERLVDTISDKYRMIGDYYGDVLIAMTEAVNNAIVHGNRLDDSKDVVVKYRILGKDLLFKIIDEGPGFDYDTLPDPTAPENIERPNGRGVFLMRNLADKCNFEDDGRIVELTFTAVFD